MLFGRTGRAAAALLFAAGPAAILWGGARHALAASPQMKSTPRSPAETAASPAGASPYRFVDVAPEAGLTRVVLAGRPGKDHLLDSAGTGAAWLDYDRDGLLDCYVVNDWRIEGDKVVEKGKNALYRQRRDHTFEDVTDAAGVGGEGEWGAGVFVADYDADGWPDMLVTNYGKNVLYRNLGNGRFENVAARVGLESPGWNTGAAWFDADGDGDLDVYIAQYIDQPLSEILAAKPTLSWRGLEMVAVGPFGLKGAPDHFFRNEGAGRFVDATLEAGMEDKALAFGFSVRAADFDGDGDLDVYVANDSDPNYLYRNDGKGHFTEVATWTGCALDENGAAQASMGLAVGDVDRRRARRHLRQQLRRGLLDPLPPAAGRAVGGRLEEERRRPGHVPHAGLGRVVLRPRQRRRPRHPRDERAHLPADRPPPGADRHLRAALDPPRQPRPSRARSGAAVRRRDRRGGTGLAAEARAPRPRRRGLRRRRRPRPAHDPARWATGPAPQRQPDGLVARGDARGREGRHRRRSAPRCASRRAAARSGATSPRATRTCPPTTRAPTSASARPRSSTSSRSAGPTARRRSSATCRPARTCVSSSRRDRIPSSREARQHGGTTCRRRIPGWWSGSTTAATRTTPPSSTRTGGSW